MLALFIPLALIWVVATLTAYVCLMMTMVSRFFPEGDRRKVPHYLRFTYLWGFIALGCVGISAALLTVDFLIIRHSILTVTGAQWLEYAGSCFSLGPYAAINILPAGICWIWWHRSYGAS